MKVSGFTFVRNAVKLDFPVVECIRSVLPMVDEFVVAVGESEDGTLDLIRSIGDPKIFIVPTRWNPNISSGGYVLAQQTNVALMCCTGDWAIYVQGDEAIHEADHDRLRELMAKYRDDDRVESLSFRRTNFFGSYRTYCEPELDLCARVVKPHRFVLSRGDAAGFTVHPKYKERGRRITTVDTGLRLFHYMEIRSEKAATAKSQAKIDLWSGSDRRSAEQAQDDRYFRTVPRSFLHRFEGDHPAPMRERVLAHGFSLDLESPRMRKRLTATEWKMKARGFLARNVSLALRCGAASSRLVAVEQRPGGPLPGFPE
jgi:hypothetical protein